MSPDAEEAGVAHEITGKEKLRRVTQLLEKLRLDLREITLLPHERDAALEELKGFGRSPEYADPIFTKDGVEILIRHGFHSTSSTTSRAALQCLSNALLAKPCTRQIFVDNGYSIKATARLKNPKKDDEFLMSRLLFLTSYGTSQNFCDLIDMHHLADHINSNIAAHSKRYAKSEFRRQKTEYDDGALSETLKLLFNITHFCPQKKYAFSKSILHILRILSRHEISILPGPVHQPINHLINSLLNLDLESKNCLINSGFHKVDSRASVEKLIRILDASLRHYTDSELDSAIVPLLTLLKRLAHINPSNVNCLMKASLLPTGQQQYDNKSNPDSLPSRLLRLLAAPVSTSLHDAISVLVFELSDRDSEQVTEIIGVGMTSGFLLSRNLQFSSNSSSTASTRSMASRSSTTSQSFPLPPRTEERSAFDFRIPSDNGLEKTLMVTDDYDTRLPEDKVALLANY